MQVTLQEHAARTRYVPDYHTNWVVLMKCSWPCKHTLTRYPSSIMTHGDRIRKEQCLCT